MIISRHPASARGAYRDRHGRWKRDAVDVRVLKRADSARTKAFLADGKGVWSWSPDAGIKFAGDDPVSDGDNQSPVSGESPL